MRKKVYTNNKHFLLALIGLLFVCFAFSTTGLAETVTVDDRAGLFSEEQIQTIEQKAHSLDETIKGRIFIVTTAEYVGDQEEFSDKYLLDTIGADNNGAVLLLDMYDRELYVSTSGNMIDYVTNSRKEDMLDAIQEDMKRASYFDATQTYLSNLTKFVEKGVPGGHYRIDRDTGKITRYKVLTATEATIGVLAALILSIVFFVLIKLKYQLKFGTYKYPYRDKSSLQLTDRDDTLVNSFVTTRRIPKPSNNGGGGGGGGSTTHSSGGGTFGGGGRSF
ncbi:hypothetical protein IGI37_000947 [Enterococcus sp. AZ194]|uniref:TPM domain-containing protein n=1 Tax=Enterococcus sp. AZ194 TaxID=2774629 RepID=UPI003F2791A7